MKKLLKTLRVGMTMALLMNSGWVCADPAAYAMFVSGAVQIKTVSGQTLPLQKGSAVNAGDELATAADATAQIKMRDGGLIAMRSDTRLKIDSYQFSGQQDGTERSFFSLFKGGFRAITGLIGQLNKSSYRVATPSATIGIRGTDHEVFVVVPEGTWARVAPVGTYDRVSVGATSMSNERGTIDILPNQMGFVGAADQMPQLQPINPQLFAAMKTADGRAGERHQVMRATAEVDNFLSSNDTDVGYSSPANTNFIFKPITVTVTTVTAGPNGGVTAAPRGGTSVITF